jgi:(E)-4-hydroxy-3-methylbut-2-enyl-diphosphate synthase
MNLIEIKNFLKTWIDEKRNKISKKLYKFDDLNKDIKDLCFFLIKNKILEKIQNYDFQISDQKKTNSVFVNHIKIGGSFDPILNFQQNLHNRKIVIQSMAISALNNIDELFKEFCELCDAGAEIIRIAVLGIEDAKNMEKLCKKLELTKYKSVPIVMCGQYNVFPVISQTNILQYISKLRINPGNISLNKDNVDNFTNTIKYLIDFNKGKKNDINKKRIAIRIGVNWGSLDSSLKSLVIDTNSLFDDDQKEINFDVIALVLSVIHSSLYAEMLGFDKDLIVASCKTSEAEKTYLCAKLLSILSDYPIHLGITEAGSGDDGLILSSVGLAPILREGIGDTIRISITPKIFEKRTKEVIIAKQILSSIGLYFFKPKVTSCPGCGRTDSQYFRILAEEIKDYIEKNIDSWVLKYNNEKIRHLKLAVMGCLVNGPGEMSHADIGISLPGFRESGSCLVYLDQEKYCVLKGENIKNEFIEIIEGYIEKKFNKNTISI